MSSVAGAEKCFLWGGKREITHIVAVWITRVIVANGLIANCN
jgi:hypothetical protein